MLATLLSVALFALPALAGFSIQTPKQLQSCSPVVFTWSNGISPFDLVIVASDAPCGDILADLGGGHKDTTLTWSKVVLPESMIGKNVSLSLQDADGNDAWSDSIPYVQGSDTSCLTTTKPGTSTISVPANVAATPSTSHTTSPGAVAAGAANVGHNPNSSGTITSRQISGSVFAATALVALLTFAL
jgi:hypothetical protein